MNHYFDRNKQIDDVLERLDELLQKYSTPAELRLLDEAEAMDFLKVSRRTLAKWRAEKVLPTKKLGGKIYYKLSEIIEALDKSDADDYSEKNADALRIKKSTKRKG
jgi:hypothetical protein